MSATLRVCFLLLGVFALAACSEDSDNPPSNPTGTDTVPPTVVVVSPPDDSIGLEPGMEIRVEFSEPMDTSVDLVTSVLSSHGRFADISWQGDSAFSLRFQDLPVATLIVIGVTTGLTDVSGNALEETFVIYYTTWSKSR